MDLGKMLAEAIEAALEGNGQVVPHRPHHVVVRGEFDLTAAAEAFLAKVREAERFMRATHEGIVCSNTLAFVRLDQTDGVVRMAVANCGIKVDTAHHIKQEWPSLPRYTDFDHTGPVPYHGEVE